MSKVIKRCKWAEGVSLDYIRYHDEEWGVPVHDDRTQFEFLVLEGAQAGLSWSTILNKRAGYKKLFADYLKTWYDLGCWHIQCNVVDKDVLLDAQKHPENYPDLVVRVAGYSSYWVDLGKPMQDDIIKRTEQSFGC